jgi:hypothetical protein
VPMKTLEVTGNQDDYKWTQITQVHERHSETNDEVSFGPIPAHFTKFCIIAATNQTAPMLEELTAIYLWELGSYELAHQLGDTRTRCRRVLGDDDHLDNSQRATGSTGSRQVRDRILLAVQPGNAAPQR